MPESRTFRPSFGQLRRRSSSGRAAVTSLAYLALAVMLAGFAIAEEPTKVQPSSQRASEVSVGHDGHERIFFVVPAFGITNRQDAPPFTAKAKFALAARQAFDPFVWISTGIQSGMSQANNEFPQYGQGAAGYGKRYGAAMLDTVNGGFTSAAFCILLKQDPRYFRLGRGSIPTRIAYSMVQEFSAKSDKGTRQFNWSNVLGTFASSAISNAYYPRPNRGFGLTMNRAEVSLMWGFTGELADEFWPDVKRKFFHGRKTGIGDRP